MMHMQVEKFEITPHAVHVRAKMAHLDILEADMARAGARADAEIRNAGRVKLAIKHEAVDDEVLALAKFNGPRPAGALRARG